jgi:rhamnosyltransferase
LSAPIRADIAAFVVLYNPGDGLLDNVAAYAEQVDRVIAVDNSERPDDALRAELIARGVEYVPMGGNAGIAAALNAGCRRATELGYSWALTMDQDSTATPGMVAALASVLEADDADRIAIVAPLWQQVGGLTEETGDPLVELDIAMTSGNLLRMSAFDSLGGFREDFFIDQVDHEFCLRARRAGWRIVQNRTAVLNHRMGSLQEVRFPVHCFITDYSPLRRYYMVRNLFEMNREFGADFPGFMAQQLEHWRTDLAKIVLAEPHRLQKIRMMYRGWRDYRKRRFGRYDVLHSS